jgi:hypothetical protein
LIVRSGFSSIVLERNSSNLEMELNKIANDFDDLFKVL